MITTWRLTLAWIVSLTKLTEVVRAQRQLEENRVERSALGPGQSIVYLFTKRFQDDFHLTVSPCVGGNHLTWRVTHNGRIIFEHTPNKRTFPKNGRQPVGRRQRAFPAPGDFAVGARIMGNDLGLGQEVATHHWNICCKLCWQWSVHCWGGQHRIRWSKIWRFSYPYCEDNRCGENDHETSAGGADTAGYDASVMATVIVAKESWVLRTLRCGGCSSSGRRNQ